MEPEEPPGPGDMAAELSQAIARLSSRGEAITDALARRPPIDTAAIKDALASVRRAARLLDRLSALITALERQEAAVPTPDPVERWARAVATAIERADPRSLRELAEQAPDAVPSMIAAAAQAAADGDWGTGRSLADYVLGRIVGMGTSPELGRVACATAVLAARAWMTWGSATTQRCQGYLQLAQSLGGTTARLQAALAQMQRTTGELGLAQDSAVLACSLDPTYPRGQVERALALAAVGSDTDEAVQTAVKTASARNHPYESLTDLVGSVPDAVLLGLAQACQTSRPEVARQALDALIMAAEPRPLSPSEGRQETILRRAQAYRLRAALPETPTADRPGAGAGGSAADLYSAAVLVGEFDEKLSRELLTQTLSSDPQHRAARLMLGDLLRFRADKAVPPSAGLLREAAGHIRRARQSPAPATDVEWERRIVATLLTTQASAQPHRALGRLLQAALELERSVLDGTASVWLYMLQSRLFSRLDLWSWARAALERATQLSPDEAGLWEEQVLLDVNSGAYKAAVERTGERKRWDWSRAARAVALAELGEPHAAVELLTPLVSQPEAPIWYAGALARAYYLAGQHEAARAQLKQIVAAKRTEWTQDDRKGSALLRLGRLEEAEKILRRSRPEPSDQVGRQWRLALCRLVREPDEARGPLLAGLAAEALPSALRNAAWEFDAVREVAERLDIDDPRRAKALAVLENAGTVVNRRLRSPWPAADRQAELQRSLHLWLTPLDGSDNSPGEETSAARTLAAILTARLATEQSNDARDLALYAELRGSALDDVVSDVLQRRSAEVRAEIGAAVSREEPQHALMLYQALISTAGDAVTPDLAALGVAMAVWRGDLPGVLEASAQVLAAAATSADAARCMLSVEIPVDREALLQGLAAAASAAHDVAEGTAAGGAGTGTDGIAADIAPGRPSPASALLAAVRAEIGQRATEDAGHPAPVSYDARRLTAELGEALVPEDTSSAWKLFSQDIPAMRERIRDRLGLDLSGVLVRYGALDPYAFRILLDGLEVMTGELVPNEQADGVPAPERLEVLTEAIERTVLAAPGTFLSVSQLELLVRQVPAFWADTTPDPAVLAGLADLTASPDTMVQLARVLRALLDDGLYVGELADLVTLVQRAGFPRDHPADVRCRIRSKAAGYLVAARPGSRGVRLPEDLERAATSAAGSAPMRPSDADGDRTSWLQPTEIVDLLVRTWPEVLQACRATEMPVVVVADEPARAWLQRVLRDHLLPGVVVTATEMPDLAAEVPSAWRSPGPLASQAERLPLPGSQ